MPILQFPFVSPSSSQNIGNPNYCCDEAQPSRFYPSLPDRLWSLQSETSVAHETVWNAFSSCQSEYVNSSIPHPLHWSHPCSAGVAARSCNGYIFSYGKIRPLFYECAVREHSDMFLFHKAHMQCYTKHVVNIQRRAPSFESVALWLPVSTCKGVYFKLTLKICHISTTLSY